MGKKKRSLGEITSGAGTQLTTCPAKRSYGWVRQRRRKRKELLAPQYGLATKSAAATAVGEATTRIVSTHQSKSPEGAFFIPIAITIAANAEKATIEV